MPIGKFADNVAGTSFTSGASDPYHITGYEGQHNPFTELDIGETYAYKTVYYDGEPGQETGTGAWDGSHLSRAVKKSSNSNNPVAWSGSELLIVIVADSEMLEAAYAAVMAHIADTGNPHSVTKAQVGLGSVPDTDFTADVAAAAAHAGSTANPHAVTKAQVGLGNVPNVDTTNASNITTGTLPNSVLPPLAITSVQVAADQTAMLALTTEQGDVVVRSDLNASYIRNAGVTGTMADFNELLTPTDAVLSVATLTGVITKAALLSAINVEDGADVTNTAKVTAAGAVMDSEVASLSGVKTLVVPDSTTISPLSATVLPATTKGEFQQSAGINAALGPYETVCFSTSTGTGSVALTGVQTKLVNGQRYEVHTRYADNATAGYEQSWGIYSSAGGGSITRDVIGESSAGYRTAVLWGAGLKQVTIFGAESSMVSASRIALSLPAHLDVRIGGVGQSNQLGKMYVNPANAVQVVDNKIWHYATNGQAESGRPKSWRVLDPTTQVLADDEWFGGLPVNIVGTAGRKKWDAGTSSYRYTTSPTVSFARRIAAVMGRRVRIIDAALGGQNFEAGYLYQTANNTINTFVAAVTAALAALPAEQKTGGVEKLHFLVYGQGETDMGEGKSGSIYGHQLSGLIKLCENPLAYNITDRNTIYLILGTSKQYRYGTDTANGQGVNPAFDGWRIAASLIGPQAKHVSIPAVTLSDTVHYTGEDCDIIADAMVRAVVSPADTSSQSMPAWTVQPKLFLPDVLTSFVVQTPGAGAITSGQLRFATDYLSVQVSKYTSNAFAVYPIYDYGMKNLKAGDIFKLGTVDNTPTMTVTVTGPMVASTDYVTIPVSVTGTPITSGTVYMETPLALADESNAEAITPFIPVVNKLAQGNESNTYGISGLDQIRQLMVDYRGQVMRMKVHPPLFNTITTTDSAATKAAECLYAPLNSTMFVDVLVGYCVPAAASGAGQRGWARVTGVVKRPSSGAGVIVSAPTVTWGLNEFALGTVPALALYNISSVYGFKVNVTGYPGTVINWVVDGRVTVLPN